jgi:hypothetical protein
MTVHESSQNGLESNEVPFEANNPDPRIDVTDLEEPFELNYRDPRIDVEDLEEPFELLTEEPLQEVAQRQSDDQKPGSQHRP